MTQYEENCKVCGQKILRIAHNTSDHTLKIVNPDWSDHKCRKRDIERHNKTKTDEQPNSKEFYN